jgi:hypothetical protein
VEGEVLPSPAAAEAVVATLWYRRKVTMGDDVVKIGERGRHAVARHFRRAVAPKKMIINPKAVLDPVATTSLNEMITPVSQQQHATTRLIDFEEGWCTLASPSRQFSERSQLLQAKLAPRLA